MKYGYILPQNHTAAQILQVSETGWVCRTAFVQPDGQPGAYSEVEEDYLWEGRTVETEAQAVKLAMAE